MSAPSEESSEASSEESSAASDEAPPPRRSSGIKIMLGAVVLAVAVFAASLAFTRGEPPAVQNDAAGEVVRGDVSPAAPASQLDDAISGLQARLRDVPGDYTAWASLGDAYVQQAAVTGNPTYYPQAEEALEASLELRPEDNVAALTGLAALAAARHDFDEALLQAEAADEIDPSNANNLAIMSDALIQLGRYDEGFAALERMLQLRPGVPAFTRASYVFELRGELDPAEEVLRRSLEIATSGYDAAYSLFYLGELAWNSGDLDAAATYYVQAADRAPEYIAPLTGQAKVAAALGDEGRAIELYEQVVTRQPTPSNLVDYGELLESLGRDDEAQEQYEIVDTTQTLFEAQGSLPEADLVLFEADHGDPEEALAAAEALWEEQRSIDVADAYAWALHVNGQDREALRYARQAVRLGTQSALFAFHRGMIEQSLGMDRAAERSLQRALELNPHFSPLLAPVAEAALEDLA